MNSAGEQLANSLQRISRIKQQLEDIQSPLSGLSSQLSALSDFSAFPNQGRTHNQRQLEPLIQRLNELSQQMPSAGEGENTSEQHPS